MTDTAQLPLRAENNPKFYRRFVWLGVGALGFMVWCLYDARVTYPAQKLRSEGLLKVAEETLAKTQLEELTGNAHGLADVYQRVLKRYADLPGLKEAYEAKAAEEGWPATPYKKLRGDGDILGNYIMAVAAGLAGVWFLFTVWRVTGRWFELGADGITTRWGERFTLDRVTTIDKKLWRDKGIAKLRYKDEAGRQRTFVVDNYKYIKKDTDRALYLIEQAVGLDKIVNGKPDDDPDAVPAEASPAPSEASRRAEAPRAQA